MKVVRIVVSDLHLGTGQRRGELNPLEDFVHDERFAEMLAHHDAQAGEAELELVLAGDIFDLLKVKIDGTWPTEITAEIAAEKLRRCLEGHPVFVQALRRFVARPRRRITYLPGNHDLDLWFPAAQDVFRRYVAPGPLGERVRFVTSSDTYHLDEGIQIRHGHQLERIHRVDYARMTTRTRDGREILALPWGSLWILEVMNPAKERRSHIDRIQPLRRFLIAALLFDTRFAIGFLWRSMVHFLRRRLFALSAWWRALRNLPRTLSDEIFTLGGFDEAATRELRRLRGVHTLIVGHSHAPRYRALPGGKVLVNTGTWIRMINLDLSHLGQDSGLTYALVEHDGTGPPRTALMRWHGTTPPCEVVPYAD
ncbi:MAG: metallophosphoesterase [Myxococcota bacterium]|nr:metallophosphoesterase [Myxococcota bacterium]MDW8361644.1 metallophosphoesterase [Myxococcales bacterium]